MGTLFFDKAKNGYNDWWRYILVTIVVGLGYMIGQLPLALAITRSSADNPDVQKSQLEEFSTNPDFTAFGINSNMGFALLLLMFVGAMTAFYFIFKPVHNREFKSLVNPFSKIRWNRIYTAFGLWLLMTLILEVVAYFVYPDNYTFSFRWNTFIPLVLISLLILPIQTSTEELFFRGYIMQGTGMTPTYKLLSIIGSIAMAIFLYTSISKFDFMNVLDDSVLLIIIRKTGLLTSLILISLGLNYLIISMVQNLNLAKDHFLMKKTKLLPLIISSVLFGLIHAMNPEIEKFGFGIMQAYYISAGLVLGIMTIMDNGLELALGVHAATNFSGAVFVGYSGAAIQTDALFKTDDVNPVLLLVFFIIISICFLLYMKNKFQWASFSSIFETIEDAQEDDIINEKYNIL